MRLAITHRYDFGAEAPIVGDELAGVAAWDALRTRTAGAFALPSSRDEWIAHVRRPEIDARAAAIAALGRRSLASYGVGAGALEGALARRGLRVVATEFAPATVERLGAVTEGITVVRHDLRCDGPLDGVDLHLLHRVDTELDDDAFAALLRRFRRQPVLVVATEVLSARAILRELRTRFRTGARVAGLVRSSGAFEALFRETHVAHRLTIHDLHGWLLEPRS